MSRFGDLVVFVAAEAPSDTRHPSPPTCPFAELLRSHPSGRLVSCAEFDGALSEICDDPEAPTQRGHIGLPLRHELRHRTCRRFDDPRRVRRGRRCWRLDGVVQLSKLLRTDCGLVTVPVVDGALGAQPGVVMPTNRWDSVPARTKRTDRWRKRDMQCVD